jgi:drug/metabolite transporter (DMT)-like permease
LKRRWESDAARGYAYTVICAVCAGAVPTLFKLLLSDDGPVVVSGLGMILSGVLLQAYRPGLKAPRGSLPYLLFLGLVGAGAAYLMWATGLSETTAVNASLLANAEVLFTAIIAYVLLGERLGRGQAVMGVLIAAGIVVVSTNFDLAKVQFMQGLLGNLLIIGATLLWAVENNVIAAVASRFGAPAMSKFRNLIGGVVIVGATVLAGLPVKLTEFDAVALVLLALAISGTTYFFIAALQRLGAIRMILTYSLSTVFGAAFALVVLREQITAVQLAGGALIIAGVYLFHRRERPTVTPQPPPGGVAVK